MAIRLLSRAGANRRGATGWWQLVLSWLLAIAVAPLVLAQADRQHLIKAAFIEKFTRFTEWPESSAGADPRQTFILCVAGADPALSHALDELVSLTPIKGRQATLRRNVNPAAAEGCHLLFIGGTEQGRLPEWLAHTHDKPILTIGDTPGFGERGVIVNFIVEGDRLRFEINRRAGQAAGLSISSRLLDLARIVGGE